MFELKSEKKSYSINLATDIKEITPDVLGALTEGIHLPKHYCIIALCYSQSLMHIATSLNSKGGTANAFPLLASIGQEDATKINAVVGRKVIIDRSSLERGVHIHVASVGNTSGVAKFIKDDIVLTNRLARGGDGSEDIINLPNVSSSKKQRQEDIAAKSPQVFIVEFKIVPVNDIVATIAVDNKTIDPFKKKLSTLVS